MLKRIAYCIGTTALFFVSLFLVVGVQWILRHFPDITAEQLLFHLVIPMDGADGMYVASAMKRVVSISVATAAFAFAADAIYRGRYGLGKYRRSLVRFLAAALCVFFAASILRVEQKLGLVAHYRSGSESSTYFDERYRRQSAGDIAFPRGKRNLILIVVESFENTFFAFPNPATGSNHAPNIRKLEEKGVVFAGHRQTRGTGWSAAGLCSFLFGVPLLVPQGSNNLFGGIAKRILPGADSVLGLMEAHGYGWEVYCCTSGEFGGTSKFFDTHLENCFIEDRDVLKAHPKYDPEKDSSEWGVNDDFLFARLKERLGGPERPRDPFAVVAITVNTHFPGLPSPYHTPKWNDYRDSIEHMDALVSDFVEWAGRQDFASETCIVVIGDHLAMLGPEDYALPPFHERSAYFLAINPVNQPGGRRIQRFFASWDVAPTLLECVGAEFSGKLGLGTSLFGSEPTLFEKGELELFEKESGKRSALYFGLLTGANN